MRKQTKLVAVLSAAALLAIGASMTSFAATGWVEEDGSWVYYSKDGDRVENEWQKSGNNWFYLNEDGDMATDALVTDSDNYGNTFYVDANGSMVTNQWVQVENEDYVDGDDDSSTVWYYFQANGKAYKTTNNKTSFKTINGKKYTFNEDGHMLYGWVGDSADRISGDDAWETGTYFCGDVNDGTLATGWAQIYCVDDDKEDEDQNYWFYFSSTGKKTLADIANAKTNVTKTINGKKYTFDDKGVMQSEWYKFYTASPASAANSYKYYNSPEDGHRITKGWFNVVPEENVNASAFNDDSTKWYYADNNGDLYTSKSGIKSIGGKKYAFNGSGEMLSGLQAVKTVSGTLISFKLDDADKIKACTEKTSYTNSDGVVTSFVSGWTIYYFGASDDGSMKTGNQNLTIDGDSYTYVFTSKGTKKGQGEDGVMESKYITSNGQKVKAAGDAKYQAVASNGVAVTEGDYTWSAIGGKYLVNTSGSIQKNKKAGVKDLNERYYVTNSSGAIVAIYTKDDNKVNAYCGLRTAINATFAEGVTESVDLNN